MPQFRKKPVVIEAIQLKQSRQSILEINEFMEGKPLAFPTSISQDKWHEYCEGCLRQGGIKIRTLESHDADLLASFGDWIIKGVQGEFYPCKPDIFDKTYESVVQPDLSSVPGTGEMMDGDY